MIRDKYDVYRSWNPMCIDNPIIPNSISIMGWYLKESFPMVSSGIDRNEKNQFGMITLWWTNKKLWKITIFHGKIHYKWPFSIAMLVHQRVVRNMVLGIFVIQDVFATGSSHLQFVCSSSHQLDWIMRYIKDGLKLYEIISQDIYSKWDNVNCNFP